VLNLGFIFLCFSLLFLQACQQKANPELIQNKQNAAVYNTQLGLAYLKQGDKPRAKEKLLKALDLAPNSAEVNASMAYYFENTGDLKEAGALYRKALALAPKNGSQLNNYGSFLCRQGRYKESESYFLKAVSDIHYVQTAGAYENAGLCAAAIPNLSKAELYFSRALKQDPQRKQSLYELVRIALKRNQAKKALAYLKTYPKLSLNEPALLVMAADASHRLGYTKAEKEYKLRLKNRGNNEYDKRRNS
jgi:type IV pilus assembly protein PilF